MTHRPPLVRGQIIQWCALAAMTCPLRNSLKQSRLRCLTLVRVDPSFLLKMPLLVLFATSLRWRPWSEKTAPVVLWVVLLSVSIATLPPLVRRWVNLLLDVVRATMWCEGLVGVGVLRYVPVLSRVMVVLAMV